MGSSPAPLPVGCRMSPASSGQRAASLRATLQQCVTCALQGCCPQSLARPLHSLPPRVASGDACVSRRKRCGRCVAGCLRCALDSLPLHRTRACAHTSCYWCSLQGRSRVECSGLWLRGCACWALGARCVAVACGSAAGSSGRCALVLAVACGAEAVLAELSTSEQGSEGPVVDPQAEGCTASPQRPASTAFVPHAAANATNAQHPATTAPSKHSLHATG
jgi:hypothetical protein